MLEDSDVTILKNIEKETAKFLIAMLEMEPTITNKDIPKNFLMIIQHMLGAAINAFIDCAEFPRAHKNELIDTLIGNLKELLGDVIHE